MYDKNQGKLYVNSRRELPIEKLQERFDLRQKLRRDEVDRLFPGYKFNTMQYRYLERGIRYQGILDIETADFDPREKFIICWVMIIRDVITGEAVMYEDAITKNDIHIAVEKQTFHFDYGLLQSLSEYIKKCNQVVGHYSSKFDVPYFRTRCMLTGQDDLIPDFNYVVYGDTWRMMKQSMKAPRNTLKNLISYTGQKDEKTFVDLKYWYSVYFKDHRDWQKSMNYIIDHCKKDVGMTYKALLKIEKFNNIGMMKV